MIRLAIIAAAGVLALCTNQVLAAEPEQADSLDEIKTRWTEAAANVSSFHAEVRRIEYDHVYHRVTEQEGTLAVQYPDRYRLELRPVSSSRRKPVEMGDVKYVAERGSARTTVSNGEELFFINPEHRICEVAPTVTAEETSQRRPAAPADDSPGDRSEESLQRRDALVKDGRTEKPRAIYNGEPFWEKLVAVEHPVAIIRPTLVRVLTPIAQLAQAFQSMGEALGDAMSTDRALLLLAPNPEILESQGFELIHRTGAQPGISAILKSKEVAGQHGVRRIDLLFDSESGLPFASRAIYGDSHKTVVHVLENVTLNALPERADLFDANLEQLESAGYTISRFGRANNREDESTE